MDLARIELLCQEAYSSPDAASRSRAEAELNSIASPLDLCRGLMESGQNPYGLFYACTTMTKLLTTNWGALTGPQKVEIKNFILTFLAKKGPSLPSFAANVSVHLMCRIAKLGWMDDETFRGLPADVNSFLTASAEHCALGLRLLDALVGEFNTVLSRRTLTQHRKLAVSFRDHSLLPIFQTALITLRRLSEKALPVAGPEQERALLEQGLQLVLSCLNFDFCGIFVDESSEDAGTVQVPASWRPIFEDANTLPLFWTIYGAQTPPCSSLAMQCLVLISSVRRAIFSNDIERRKFLTQLLQHISHCLASGTGLSHQENFHEVCRLIARIKLNVQLQELVQNDNYDTWIRLTAEFTVRSFNLGPWVGNSVFYLLGLWSRLVASLPYHRGPKPTNLEAYIPQIVAEFLQSRLKMIQDNTDLSESVLDDEEQLHEQLEAIPSLARCQYDTVAPGLESLFDPVAAMYAEGLEVVRAGGPLASDPNVLRKISVLEDQLAWMIHCIGSIIGQRASVSSPSEAHDVLDGNLSARVLRVLQSLQAARGRTEKSLVRLETAVLHFFQFFRRAYIGESTIASSKIFPRLAEILGAAGADHLAIMDVIVQKAVSNLNQWADNENIVRFTLNLLADLANGLSSSKLMLKLDVVRFMLTNHSTDHFAFLRHDCNIRIRTKYYTTLTRLLFTESESPESFFTFMRPLSLLCNSILSATPSADALRATPAARSAVVGWLRDLRGVCFGCGMQRSYNLFFEWFFAPQAMIAEAISSASAGGASSSAGGSLSGVAAAAAAAALSGSSSYSFTPGSSGGISPESRSPALQLLHLIASSLYDTPSVIVPLLKFMAELTRNQSMRITFESTSPNGFVLFRETMCILDVVSRGLMTRAASAAAPRDPYAEKYKPISTALLLLTRALSGNFCNVSVFALYKDRCLSNAVATCLSLALSCPIADLLSLPKVCRSFFALVEVLFKEYSSLLFSLSAEDPRFLVTLASALDEGIKSQDSAISSQCCAAVDYLCTYFHKLAARSNLQITLSAGGAAGSRPPITAASLMPPALISDILPRIMGTLLQTIVFEESQNQWNMSRPMLSLIVVLPETFADLKARCISSISGATRQASLGSCFEKLMERVDATSLEARNRDIFTQNLNVCRAEMKVFL